MSENEQDGWGEPEHPWKPWVPEGGWAVYASNDAVSDAIWNTISESTDNWFYMNFTSTLSLWEWSDDGSAILIEYKDNRIVTLSTNGGGAERFFLEVTAPFGLIAEPYEKPSADSSVVDSRLDVKRG